MVIARCCNPLPPFGNHAVSCRFYALLLSSILHLEKKTSRLSNEKLLNYSVRIMPIGIVEVHQKNMIITKNIRPFLVFVNEKVLKSQISNFFDSWRHMLRDFDFDYSYCIVLPLCVSMNMATIPHLSTPTVGNCSTTSWPKFSDFCWPFYQRISALQFVDNRLQVLSARSLFINQLFCCTHRTFLPASGGGKR